jgi:hypothetical protein
MVNVSPNPIAEEARSILDVLWGNTAWGEISPEQVTQLVDGADPVELGHQFTLFLKNGGRVIDALRAIPIKRPTIYDLTAFIGKKGGIGKRPWEMIYAETDNRSTIMESLDISNVRLESMLRGAETIIPPRERIARVKEAGYIRLDTGMFMAYWENKHLIPERYKEKIDGSDCIVCFDGGPIVGPFGEECVFCIYWLGNEWHWSLDWLDGDGKGAVSAVLPDLQAKSLQL